MQNHHNKVLWAIIASQVSHILCCGIPLFVSAMSLLAGIGMMSAMPSGLERLHYVMHGYEIEMIVFSSIVLAVGWGLHVYATRIDCHNTGCAHEPCGTKKKTVNRVLIAATVLFVINIAVFFVFH